MKVRRLNNNEKRIIRDALARAACESRVTALEAAQPSPLGINDAHARALLELGQTQDRLASEIAETTNIVLEKL